MPTTAPPPGRLLAVAEVAERVAATAHFSGRLFAEGRITVKLGTSAPQPRPQPGRRYPVIALFSVDTAWLTSDTLAVRPSAPPLLPVLRSRLTGDLLALVLADPHRPWRTRELADHAQAPYQTVTAEIRRLEQAQLVRTTTIGRSKLVTANPDHPDLAPLTTLILRSFGPPQVVSEEFADVAGVETAWIYGSWAARHAGQPGAPPGDVDVLVLGERINRDELYDAARRAEARLGRPVNTTVRSPAAWEHQDDAFARTVRSRPMVAVTGPDAT